MCTCIVLYELFFICNVVFAAFLCKHVRLLCAFYSKLTYLITFTLVSL